MLGLRVKPRRLTSCLSAAKHRHPINGGTGDSDYNGAVIDSANHPRFASRGRL